LSLIAGRANERAGNDASGLRHADYKAAGWNQKRAARQKRKEETQGRGFGTIVTWRPKFNGILLVLDPHA